MTVARTLAHRYGLKLLDNRLTTDTALRLDRSRNQAVHGLRERMTKDSDFRSFRFTEPEAALKSFGFNDTTASALAERVGQTRVHAEWITTMNRARDIFDAEGKAGIAACSTEELVNLGAAAAFLVEVTQPRTDEVLRAWGGEPEWWHQRVAGREINAGWAAVAADELEARQIPSSQADDLARAVQAMPRTEA